MKAVTVHPRRVLLQGVLLGAAGAVLDACTDAPGAVPSRFAPTGETRGGPPPSSSAGSAVLLAYFSRAGKNYFNGGRTRLTVGNTQVVADMISRLIGCDVHRIEAADPYPEDYDPTVARNVREQQADARPGIAGPLPSIGRPVPEA